MPRGKQVNWLRVGLTLPISAVGSLVVLNVPDPLPAANCQAARCTAASILHEMTPVADTWYEVDVGTGVPVNATPQGSTDELSAGWSDIGINQRTLMRFAVPTSVPDHRVESAELEVGVISAGIGTFRPPAIVSGTIAVSLRPVVSPWDEATLSSLTPPENGEVAVRSRVSWGPCGRRTCGTARFDLTPLVTGWMLQDSATYGVLMDATGVTDQASTGTWFLMASRESDSPPVLRIAEVPLSDGTPTPTPTPTLRATATALSSAVTPDAHPAFLPYAVGRLE